MISTDKLRSIQHSIKMGRVQQFSGDLVSEVIEMYFEMCEQAHAAVDRAVAAEARASAKCCPMPTRQPAAPAISPIGQHELLPLPEPIRFEEKPSEQHTTLKAAAKVEDEDGVPLPGFVRSPKPAPKATTTKNKNKKR